MRYGIAKCALCQKEYKKITAKHNACSEKCAKLLWYHANKILVIPEELKGTCLYCGKEFEYERRAKKRIFCSLECRNENYRTNHPNKSVSVKHETLAKCPGCHKTHKISINYIGTGTPRFFCESCKHKQRIM